MTRFDSIKVKLKLRFSNANFVGTHFRGAIFAMTDPFYRIMLLKNLEKGSVVWNKSAEIHYLKPERSDLTALYNKPA